MIDKLMNSMGGGQIGGDLLTDIDYRNHTRCKMANLENLPAVLDNFSLCHLNVRSLCAQYEECEATFDRLGSLNIISLSET